MIQCGKVLRVVVNREYCNGALAFHDCMILEMKLVRQLSEDRQVINRECLNKKSVGFETRYVCAARFYDIRGEPDDTVVVRHHRLSKEI